MERLIWFSIPGAILGIAIIAANLALVQSDRDRFLAAAAIPVLGFFVHQFYRVLFEARGGFANKSRIALDDIQNRIAPECGTSGCDRSKAFLIWEITFYSNEFSSSFRDHDSRTWHYVLSFRSGCLAAALGLLWTIFRYFGGGKQPHLVIVAAVEVVFGVILALKARASCESLMKQELAATFRWREQFAATCERLQKMP